MQTLDFTGARRSPGMTRFLQEEAQREAARNAKLMQPVQDTLREIHAQCRAAWRTPYDDLLTKFQRGSDSTLASIYFIDLGLPQVENQPEDSVAAEYKTWYDGLLARTGFVVSTTAEQKFKLFVRVQMAFGHVTVTVDTLDMMFEWFVNGDVFEESE